MRIMSTRVRRLRACGAAFVLATSAGLIPSLAVAADGPIADTKVWCGEAAKMIGDKDTQKFFASFVFASGGLIDRPSVEQAFASLPPALSREGAFISGDFLVEKAYGETLSRAWFLIQFENGLLFLRCEGAKRGNGWIIVNVTYDNQADNVRLP